MHLNLICELYGENIRLFKSFALFLKALPIGKANNEHMILLGQPSKSQDYRHEPPRLAAFTNGNHLVF